ncbi:MAG: HAD family hydrolase [Bacillota bacterium]|nr:HAD family hydrolase [Bacillota bacterium]
MKYCFDLDDTLYDCSQPFVRAMEQFFPEHCDNLKEKYKYYRYIGDVNFPRVLTKEISIDESGEIRIEEVCKKYEIPYSREEISKFQEHYKYNQYNLQLSETYKEFFENSNLTFGIITNGEDSHQRKKIQALGMTKYINPNYIITSMGIGISKPDPEIFTRFLLDNQEKAEDWFYIGDSYNNDIAASKKAGLRNIYFDRHNKKEGNQADYVVYSEEELIALIQKIEGWNKEE